MCPICHEPFSPENPASPEEFLHADGGGGYRRSPVCEACAYDLEASAAATEHQ